MIDPSSMDRTRQRQGGVGSAIWRRCTPARRWTGPLALALLGACASQPLLDFSLEPPAAILVPVADAGVDDQRGRFREILCAINEDHGQGLPDYRPCDGILHRLADEPPGTGAPVNLGPARARLAVALVSGLGAECIAGFISAFPYALEHLQSHGYATTTLKVDALSSSARNARQIRDAVMDMTLAPEQRLVLIGYSKGASDVLEAVVNHPEITSRVAAVVTIAGTVNGSLLAEEATQAELELLQYFPGAECDVGDRGALASLKRATRLKFLAEHDLPADIQYFSLVAIAEREMISALLRGPYDQLALADPRNDSQVLYYDAVIPGGALLGYANGDHWAVALPIARDHPMVAAAVVDHNAFPREVLLEAVIRHMEEQILAAEKGAEPGGSARIAAR